MTKEEFAELQYRHQESGKNLKEYLLDVGISYSTYNYWRKKFHCPEDSHNLAPISFMEESSHRSGFFPSFGNDVPSGAVLLFPNGLRAHFGSGTERVLMDLLEKSLASHVLP